MTARLWSISWMTHCRGTKPTDQSPAHAAAKSSTRRHCPSGPKLRLICTIAVATALANEDRGGYNIGNKATLDLADGRIIEVDIKDAPLPGVSSRDILHNLWQMLKHYKAVRVSMPFINNHDPNDEKICAIQLRAFRHHYFVQGRIEGMMFIRETLAGQCPKRRR